VEEIDRGGAPELKRGIVDLLLLGVTVHTTGEGRRKTAVARARFAFPANSAAGLATSIRWRWRAGT
jgi:hypothetical protein